MSCYFYFLLAPTLPKVFLTETHTVAFWRKGKIGTTVVNLCTTQYVSAPPVFLLRLNGAFRNRPGLLTFPLADQMYLSLDATLWNDIFPYWLRSSIMTRYFHEYDLILLSTTALYLTSQAYCVFQEKKKKKLL